MNISFIIDRIKYFENRDAIIWNDKSYPFSWLFNELREWQQRIADFGITSGHVVMLKADFSPNSIALFLALAKQKCIIVPFTSALTQNEENILKTAQCEYLISIDTNDKVGIGKLWQKADHALYRKLRAQSHSGLVLFSSGTTGPGKAALHDLDPIFEKYKLPKKAFRSISFLLYDHIGGVNTMLYSLSNGGCIVTVKDRLPDTVLKSIDSHCVDLLPTSPTFLNLILLSKAHHYYDLSSLKLVTYGTEPMPEATLKRFHELFPHVELRQTYGLSEVGIMQTKSKSSDSLWLKVGGDGFQTRIVNNILHVKSRSAMLGYLNFSSPFIDDGWLVTGDRVEQKGEYIKFLGRDSDVIIVGGEKVNPIAIENVLQEIDNVAEVAVYGINNSITGQVVCADIRLIALEEKREFVKRMKHFCNKRLKPFMIPVKVNLVSQAIHNDRFKKVRIRYA